MNDQEQRQIAGPALNKLSSELLSIVTVASDSIQAAMLRCITELKKIWPDPVQPNPENKEPSQETEGK